MSPASTVAHLFLKIDMLFAFFNGVIFF